VQIHNFQAAKRLAVDISFLNIVLIVSMVAMTVSVRMDINLLFFLGITCKCLRGRENQK